MLYSEKEIEWGGLGLGCSYNPRNSFHGRAPASGPSALDTWNVRVAAVASRPQAGDSQDHQALPPLWMELLHNQMSSPHLNTCSLLGDLLAYILQTCWLIGPAPFTNIPLGCAFRFTMFHHCLFFLFSKFYLFWPHRAACGIWSCGMWNLVPQPGIELGAPTGGRFLTTGPSGKSLHYCV